MREVSQLFSPPIPVPSRFFRRLAATYVNTLLLPFVFVHPATRPALQSHGDPSIVSPNRPTPDPNLPLVQQSKFSSKSKISEDLIAQFCGVTGSSYVLPSHPALLLRDLVQSVTPSVILLQRQRCKEIPRETQTHRERNRRILQRRRRKLFVTDDP